MMAQTIEVAGYSVQFGFATRIVTQVGPIGWLAERKRAGIKGPLGAGRPVLLV